VFLSLFFPSLHHTYRSPRGRGIERETRPGKKERRAAHPDPTFWVPRRTPPDLHWWNFVL
jgi:hypothetical protein